MENKRGSFFMKAKKENPKQEGKENLDHDKRQKEFNKSREGLEVNPEKKPFDKKAYRLKKYSKKYKLEQWEEKRKKRLIREYQKEIKDDPASGTYKLKSFDEDVTDSHEVGKYVRHPDLIEKNDKKDEMAKKDPFEKAKQQYNKVKQDKLKKQQEMEKVREARKQKLEEYKKKKQDRFKKLSKKTKKGQPVMTGRLELLLERIQNSK